MSRRNALLGGLMLLVSLMVVPLALGATPDSVGPIYDGPELDYQPSIIRLQPSGELMLVFERITLSNFYGDFYVAFSSDDGESWTTPQSIIDSSLNERHPSLLQLGPNSFALFYLVDETGSGGYRLHRATSSDGTNWTDRGALDLGWPTPGEINPNVIREADGTLTMTYHRFSGPSYIAQSSDDGVTWDDLKTQVSNGNAQLPRLTKRESDGLYLVAYQVGGSNLDMYVKTSTDPYDWNVPQIPLSTVYNSHDPQPITLEDGTFLVTYSQTPVYYFDVFYRTSCDGTNWSDEVQVTYDSSRYDTQSHPLPQGRLGHIILAWSHQDDGVPTPYQDHDVWVNTDLAVQANPDLSASFKGIDPTVFAPGAPLTFTLIVDNTCLGYGATTARLTDTIPGGTVYQPGSLWASSGNYGYDPISQAITWTGILSSCARASVTFQVSTSLSLTDGETITNTAWLTGDQTSGYELTATATADAVPPTSAVLDPLDGQVISATSYLLAGVASDTVSGVSLVEVSLDGGPSQPAAGTETWSFLWSGLGDGPHQVQSLASDNVGNVETPGPGITFTVDATPPGLEAFWPADGAGQVPLTASLVLTFSESILTDSLAYSLSPDPGGWSAAWSQGERVVALSHADLSPQQTYIFSLTQARDRVSNPITPTQWAFTAACDPAHVVDVVTQVAGCRVTFLAQVSGTEPLDWAWDFGPFGASAQPSPTVTFDSGRHPWRLTVLNCGGAYSDSLSGRVSVFCSPDLSTSSKSVQPTLFGPGASLTYTLRLSNTGYGPTPVWLADPLPQEVSYQPGSLWASGGDYGYDPAGRAITWTGQLSSAAQVSLTFRVSAGLELRDGRPLTNTAWLSDDQGGTYTLVATATADAAPPTSSVLDPVDGQVITATGYQVSGVASDTVSGVSLVEVSLDGGPWQPATGTETWSFLWVGLSDGQHNLRSRATDGLGQVEPAGPGITVTVEAAGAPPEVVSRRPPAGASGVALEAAVLVTFSESIDTDTFSYTVTPDPGGWMADWGRGGSALLPAQSVVTLTHAPFAPSTTYTVSLIAAADLDGSLLVGVPLSWSFSSLSLRRHWVYLPVVIE